MVTGRLLYWGLRLRSSFSLAMYLGEKIGKPGLLKRVRRWVTFTSEKSTLEVRRWGSLLLSRGDKRKRKR